MMSLREAVDIADRLIAAHDVRALNNGALRVALVKELRAASRHDESAELAAMKAAYEHEKRRAAAIRAILDYAP